MASTDGNDICPYEAARNQRVQKNKRRFQELGISKLISSVAKCTKKATKPKFTKIITPKKVDPSKLRRSRRLNKQVGMGSRLPPESYPVRVKLCSSEEQVSALKVAEDFQSKLKSNLPSLSMTLSYTDSRSLLMFNSYPDPQTLPTKFCKDHISSNDLKMVLEDGKGLEFDSDLIVDEHRAYLGGGWRGFVLAHKLVYGDALVFELIEPLRFKVYIFRACEMA